MVSDMKIGLVCPYNVARGGGVQEIVGSMRRLLVQHGYDAKIITSQPQDTSNIDTAGMIFLGRAIDVRWPTHTTASFSSGFSNESIEQMVESEKFDILHFHEPWVPSLSRQILNRSQSVNIGTFHAKIPETIVSRTLKIVVTPYLRVVLKDLHELTAVSDPAAEYVSSLTDRPINIIPNGINLKHFIYKPNKKQHNPKTILYIGRLEHRKGLKYLLEAFQYLVQDHEALQLIIAGDGPDREKLELLVQDMQLKNVQFLGYVSEEDKIKLLANADIFCSPAIYGESFGIVLLEAMASGTVVVAGNNPGYMAVMQQLGALSLANPKDPMEFARKIKLLLEENKLRDLWQKWAKDYIKQFSSEKIIKQYEQLYHEALAKNAITKRIN
jgi:phosphatidylinositol alpha-mannosyltransferase